MAYGRNTIPVITGIRASKIITASLAVLTIASLYFVWFYFLNDRITLIYLTLFIVIPYIYALYLLFSAGNKRDIHRASNLMKMIMLAGIFYSIVVKAILSWNLIS
jgi:4-hydroxybenzoate polyprenyltransferase